MRFFRLAFALPLLALACWRLFGRRSLALPRRDLLLILGLGALVALYQVLYFAAITGAGVAVAALVTLCLAPVIVAVVSLGCVPTAIAYALFLRGMRTTSATAALLAAALFHERLGPLGAVGGVLLLGAVAVLAQS